MKARIIATIVFFVLMLIVGGCSTGGPTIVYITATPGDAPGVGTPVPSEPTVEADLPTVAALAESQASRASYPELRGDPRAFVPTPDRTRFGGEVEVGGDFPEQHTVQAGDTLYGIAARYNTTLNTLLEINALTDPNILVVGQVIALPGEPAMRSPERKLLPNGLLVRGPGSTDFDVEAFVARQPGYIRSVTDMVVSRRANGTGLEELLSAAQIISRVSREFSVDPRVLLSLLEYRAGWLTNPTPPEDLRTHPLISEEDSAALNREGLYRQLAWAANELNRGYYGWKYEGWSTLEFVEGERVSYNATLNAGTVALQYFLSLNQSFTTWIQDVDFNGWCRVYFHIFGDPFAKGIDDPLPASGLTQPDFGLPFVPGETWFFTGGPHGGWGSGSAWAALDFAPPDERTDALCYTSDFWTTSVAPGVIAYSDQGSVVLDLDGDGDEATGWTVLYLHIASEGRIAEGTRVVLGDRIGKPSCEGGFSTATHMHIARRYNGEWIPAYCQACPEGITIQPFTMNGWSTIGLRNQEYQGYMQNQGERRIAEQGRTAEVNRISW